MQALDCSRGWETPPSPHGQLKTEDFFFKKGKEEEEEKEEGRSTTVSDTALKGYYSLF